MPTVTLHARWYVVALITVTACSLSEKIVGQPQLPEPVEEIPSSGVPGLGELLKSIQDATWTYRDETAARADGYIPAATGCESTSGGSMGHRYVNSVLVGLVPGSHPVTGTDTVIDPLHPEVLLYEPQEDGLPKLVGVVYVVYRDAWDAAHGEPPTFFGMNFDEKTGSRDESDYYEFTVWLWRYNPYGMFAPWNPLVNC